MNSAGSMRSQDIIIKGEKIKEDSEKYNLLPMDRVTDISVRWEDQQITGKKRKYVSSNNQP